MLGIFEIRFGGRMGGSGRRARGPDWPDEILSINIQNQKEMLAIFEIPQSSEHKLEYTK